MRYICVKMIPNFSKEANSNFVCLISNCDQVDNLSKEYAGRTRPRSTSGVSFTCSVTVLISLGGNFRIDDALLKQLLLHILLAQGVPRPNLATEYFWVDMGNIVEHITHTQRQKIEYKSFQHPCFN